MTTKSKSSYVLFEKLQSLSLSKVPLPSSNLFEFFVRKLSFKIIVVMGVRLACVCLG